MSGQSRLDPRTGATLILAEEGLTILSSGGGRAFIAAPEGYTLSHFGEGASVVARGREPYDGWRDWHFEADVAAGQMRRLGPAY